MTTDRRGIAYCTSTGLAVPECSCRGCLEAMLLSFRPELLGEEIRITRPARPARSPRPRPTGATGEPADPLA